MQSISLTLYRISKKLLALAERAIALLRVATTGFWLGILSREAFYQIDIEYYEKSQLFTSESYNLSGLSGWEEQAVNAYFPVRGNVVVLGAGAGRESIALAERGYLVDGFECHPDLLRIGNEILEARGSGATLSPMQRDECPKLDTIYDGIVIGWGAYMLIQGRARRVRLLADLRDYAAPGAVLLLSFFPRRQEERRFHLAAFVARPFRRLLKREPIEVGDFLWPTYVHFFYEEELAGELADGGWQLLTFNARDYGHVVATKGVGEQVLLLDACQTVVEPGENGAADTAVDKTPDQPDESTNNRKTVSKIEVIQFADKKPMIAESK